MSNSLQVQIETEIVSTIQGLTLAGLASENVQRQLVPLDRDLVLTALPAVRVGPQGREAYDGGTNAADDIAYPVQVLIVARTNQNLSAGSSGDIRDSQISAAPVRSPCCWRRVARLRRASG